MDLSRLLRLTLIVEHVEQDGPPDEMGDPTEVVTYSTKKGWVWQTQATEETANGTISVERWEVALERSAVLDTGDRIIVDGTLTDEEWNGDGIVYDVAGEPWRATNPRTLLVEYVQAKLDRSQ